MNKLDLIAYPLSIPFCNLPLHSLVALAIPLFNVVIPNSKNTILNTRLSQSRHISLFVMNFDVWSIKSTSMFCVFDRWHLSLVCRKIIFIYHFYVSNQVVCRFVHFITAPFAVHNVYLIQKKHLRKNVYLGVQKTKIQKCCLKLFWA